MNREEIEAEVVAVLKMVIKVEASPEASRENLPQWDSLKHIEIVFAIEDAFGVQFPEEELARLDSVRKITESVLSKHAA